MSKKKKRLMKELNSNIVEPVFGESPKPSILFLDAWEVLAHLNSKKAKQLKRMGKVEFDKLIFKICKRKTQEDDVEANYQQVRTAPVYLLNNWFFFCRR